MRQKIKLALLMITLVCSGCISQIGLGQQDINQSAELASSETATQASSMSDQAERALVGFYTALNQGDYTLAAALYGGDYDPLEGYNPDLNPADRAALLRAGCEANGLMCLMVHEILSIQSSGLDAYRFEITYANPDGTPFVLGPCCGADEESMPSISTFTVVVRCEGQEPCQVMDLPPYVP